MDYLGTRHRLTYRHHYNVNLVFLLLLSALGFSTQALAQSFGEPYKINNNISIEDVHYYYQISPDDEYVVYRVGYNDNFNLYSSAIDGSDTVKLNATLPADGTVNLLFEINSDSKYVVYVADQDIEGVFELYSSPIDGSKDPVKLNPTLSTLGDVVSFKISPDGDYVVYQGDQDTFGVRELYSTAVDGSGPLIKLNASIPTGGYVGTFEISPDGHYVVYHQPGEIYSIAIDGGETRVKLNQTGTQIHVLDHKISSDSDFIVYRATLDDTGIAELFSIAIDGSGPRVKLSGESVTDGDVSSDYQISPDGAYVVYRGDQDINGIDERFTVAQ